MIDVLQKFRAPLQMIESIQRGTELFECRRAHLLWLVSELVDQKFMSREALVLAACRAAREALPHVRNRAAGPLRAIEAAERFAQGDREVTTMDLRELAIAAEQAAPTISPCDYVGVRAADAAAWAARTAAACESPDAVEAAFRAIAHAECATASDLATHYCGRPTATLRRELGPALSAALHLAGGAE